MAALCSAMLHTRRMLEQWLDKIGSVDRLCESTSDRQACRGAASLFHCPRGLLGKSKVGKPKLDKLKGSQPQIVVRQTAIAHLDLFDASKLWRSAKVW